MWSGREDLNLRHPAPKAGALPGCATPRRWNDNHSHFALLGENQQALLPQQRHNRVTLRLLQAGLLPALSCTACALLAHVAHDFDGGYRVYLCLLYGGNDELIGS